MKFSTAGLSSCTFFRQRLPVIEGPIDISLYKHSALIYLSHPNKSEFFIACLLFVLAVDLCLTLRIGLYNFPSVCILLFSTSCAEFSRQPSNEIFIICSIFDLKPGVCENKTECSMPLLLFDYLVVFVSMWKNYLGIKVYTIWS